MLRRASPPHPRFADRIAPMKMSGLLTRNPARPGLIGTARVDRNIDRLLRRVCPGDIVVLDVLDLDRITADALVEADIAAVVNANWISVHGIKNTEIKRCLGPLHEAAKQIELRLASGAVPTGWISR